MSLGKRPRVMRRTRSISGGMAMETDDDQAKNLEPHHEEELGGLMVLQPHHHHPKNHHDHQRLVMATGTNTISNHTTQQEHNPPVILLQQTPHFLRTCGLCNCRLAPGRDIYMYRGDTPFCSLECREQQIKQDKRKEKWKAGSIREDHHRLSQPTATTKASTKTQTAACT